MTPAMRETCEAYEGEGEGQCGEDKGEGGDEASARVGTEAGAKDTLPSWLASAMAKTLSSVPLCTLPASVAAPRRMSTWMRVRVTVG